MDMDNNEIFEDIKKRLKKGDIYLYSGNHFSGEPYTLRYVIPSKKGQYITAMVELTFKKTAEGKKLLLDIYKAANYENRLIPRELLDINITK